MRTRRGYRNSYIVNGSLKELLYKNRVVIVISVLIIIGCIITGIMTALKVVDDITSDNIHDDILYKFLKSESSFTGYLFSRFLYSSAVIILMFFCSYSVILLVIPAIYIIHCSFNLGINCIVLTTLFGFSGVFNVVFIIFPCHLLTILLYILCFSIVVKRALVFRRYGRFCISNNCKTKYFWLLVVAFVLSIIEAILLNFVCNTFIFAI